MALAPEFWAEQGAMPFKGGRKDVRKGARKGVRKDIRKGVRKGVRKDVCKSDRKGAPKYLDYKL